MEELHLTYCKYAENPDLTQNLMKGAQSEKGGFRLHRQARPNSLTSSLTLACEHGNFPPSCTCIRVAELKVVGTGQHSQLWRHQTEAIVKFNLSSCMSETNIVVPDGPHKTGAAWNPGCRIACHPVPALAIEGFHPFELSDHTGPLLLGPQSRRDGMSR